MASTNGRIWIDTTRGANGNGSADDPCNSFANALTAGAGIIRYFECLPGSEIELQAALNRAVFFGEFYSVDAGEQLVTNAAFHGAQLLNAFAVGSNIRGYNCYWGDIGLCPGIFHDCRFESGTVDLQPGKYVFHDPSTLITVGTNTPIVNFGTTPGGTSVVVADGTVAWHVANTAAGDSLSVNSRGRLYFLASCNGGGANIRGDVSDDKHADAVITIDNSFAAKDFLLDADQAIDTTVSPWALVHYPKGTFGDEGATELLRQTLYDVAGNPVTSTRQVIGRTLS